MAVLDIRGTHGSGKSWIVHQLLSLAPKVEVIEENEKHLGYYLPHVDAAVIGRYANTCGGCDGVKDVAEVMRRLRLFSGQYRYVILEGILVSHTFKRYSELATEYKDYGYHFLFLDTPLQACIGRVQARRRKEGNIKPLDPKNIIKDWHNIWEGVRNKCLCAGHSVTVLPCNNPLPPVLELLGWPVGASLPSMSSAVSS